MFKQHNIIFPDQAQTQYLTPEAGHRWFARKIIGQLYNVTISKSKAAIGLAAPQTHATSKKVCEAPLTTSQTLLGSSPFLGLAATDDEDFIARPGEWRLQG
jgi:hypothetical protein